MTEAYDVFGSPGSMDMQFSVDQGRQRGGGLFVASSREAWRMAPSWVAVVGGWEARGGMTIYLSYE